MVTGGNKGVGFACCQLLGKDSAVHCVLTARNRHRGEAACETLRRAGLDVDFMQLDVSSEKSVSSFVQQLVTKYGRLDYLINNAGYGCGHGSTRGATVCAVLLAPTPCAVSALVAGRVLVETGSASDMARQTLAVNFYGVERMCRHLAPLVAKSDRGRIVKCVAQRVFAAACL